MSRAPAALAISWAAPWAIAPLLVIGGAFLCYEGAEKLLHRFLHGKDSVHEEALTRSAAADVIDPVAFERGRITGAIRTDFILSAEIIVITLGVVAGQSLGIQLGVLVSVALMMTVGVYGVVAGIVRLDDLGLAMALRRRALLLTWRRCSPISAARCYRTALENHGEDRDQSSGHW